MPTSPFSPDALQDVLVKNNIQAEAPPQSPAKQAPKKESWWPYAAMIGGQLADVGTTMQALKNPALHESNPMGLKGALIAKAIETPLVAALMHHLHNKGYDDAAKIAGVAMGARGAIPAAMNIHTMQKYKAK